MATWDLAGIKVALLQLVAEETGESVEELQKAEAFPDDAPWDSRAFVNLQFDIEKRFDIKFTDLMAVERASRTLDTMAEYVLLLVRQAAAQTA